MGWLDKLLGTALAAPAPREHIAIIARPYVNEAALAANSKRIGMWVTTPAGVGIMTGCTAEGWAQVTLCKPDGTTVMTLDDDDKAVPNVLTYEMGGVHRAYINDIPESRRGDLDRLRAMGYQDNAQ